MEKKKIDFILEVFPNVSKILDCATEDNLTKLYEQAKTKLTYQLNEASFENH